MPVSRHPDLERLLSDPGYAQSAAEAIQALGAPSRLRILARLHASPASVGELAAAVELQHSAVSHQLRLMRLIGLVVGHREGRRVIYALHDAHVARMLEQVVSHVDHVRRGIGAEAHPLPSIRLSP